MIEPFVKRTVIFPRDRLLAVCPRLEDVGSLPPLGRTASVRLLVRYRSDRAGSALLYDCCRPTRPASVLDSRWPVSLAFSRTVRPEE